VLQARDRVPSPERIESVGKRARDESGKHPVNKVSEENSGRECAEPFVIASASEAIHPTAQRMDGLLRRSRSSQ
jgi:hypothetical protein